MDVRDGGEGCTITLVNQTGEQMTLKASSAPSGYFTAQPPSNIEASQSAIITAQGTDGTATGCTVSWSYTVADARSTEFDFSFSKPYDGMNSYSVTCTAGDCGDYKITNPYTPSSTDWLTITTTISAASAG